MEKALPNIFIVIVLLTLTDSEADDLSYSTDIRPILSKNCFACHGPDEADRKAKTRLDVPGGADLKEVLARITSSDPDEVMPPPESNKTLTANEVDHLKEWIASGAEYEQHWAFALPEKTPTQPTSHPVDHFIDQRLASESLNRAPKADPFTLLRRVHLDLTGLPPTIEEADAFATDPSDTAYRAIVEKLLASPRYGERWARRWLDLARYADTNGYEKDRDRSIWPYRDWVIRAINNDMPFDQFTIEQIAGDMLPNPTSDQLVATGFHRNTMLNEEGGIDPLEFRYHAMTDRVATTGTTWLGLTTGCAQCHTHKYDPITHHDYFGMMAYLNNADEPDFFLSVKDSKSIAEKNAAKAKKLLEELPSHWPEKNKKTEKPVPDLETTFTKWLAEQKNNLTQWQTITPEKMSANHPFLTQEADGVIYASGDTSKHDIYTLTFPPQNSPINSIRLETLPDPRLPGNGPGLTYYEGRKGDFFLSEIEIENSSGQAIGFADASHTYARNAFGNSKVSAEQTTDGDIQSGWSIKLAEGRPHRAVFNFAEPIPPSTSFTVRMHFGRHYASSLGKFRLSTTTDTRPVRATLLDPNHNNESARETFLLSTPELADKATEIHRLRKPVNGTPTLVMRERPSGQTRPTFLHHRGEYTQPKEQVPPRLPTAIWPDDKPLPSDRLEFARWLISAENPLTSRVVANRQWAAFFGTGIVKTVDDFGMQGELPSHPQLLDFLAVDLIENDWSIKSLHRLIVTSQTYQQSSDIIDQKTVAADRRLLRLFPRNRLEAEIIRDTSLAAAGLLDGKMFGPPVRPIQPSAAAANYTKFKWKPSAGSDRHRRSVYTYQKRTAPFAMFTTFDGTSGEACVARRDVSNTPLQSLTLLNDPMFLDIASHYGKRIATAEGDIPQKITTGFRLINTRPPSADELQLLAAFHAEHDNWTALARVLLCLDESISKN